ncbi:hypothetical protein Tco_1315173 [Tanacetum coccineum]
MDGWMDRWTNERMDGWMDGWTDGQIDGWTDRRIDGWKDGDGWMDEWTDRQMDGRMDGRMDERINGQMEGRTDRGTDGQKKDYMENDERNNKGDGLGSFPSLSEAFGSSTSLAAKISEVESQMLAGKLVLVDDGGQPFKPSHNALKTRESSSSHKEPTSYANLLNDVSTTLMCHRVVVIL